MIRYLSKEQILFVNFSTYQSHGGFHTPPDNVKHQGNLDYVIEAVSSEMFGSEIYPTISDKAAVYFYNIICNHIFHDGNKRTGLGAAILFLRLNGFRINKQLRHDTITDFVIEVASGKLTLEECRQWFTENIVAF
jgi:death on curing protein